MGTVLAVRLYEEVKPVCPDFTKARSYVNAFDYEQWYIALRQLLGRSAEAMIALEAKEGKCRRAPCCPLRGH